MSVRKVVPIEQVEWQVSPAPAWVVPHEPDWEFTPTGGYSVVGLLVDEQHHVETQSRFSRVVRRLLNLAAVQALGQAEIEFDPAGYRLSIHEMAVWRKALDGTWSRRSFAQRDTLLLRQREQQLELQMLNGRVSVVALLEDVRVDDAIELAWTLEPRDPMEGLRFTAFFAFAWTVPIARAFFILHLTSKHPIRWRVHAPEGATVPVEEITPERGVWKMEGPTPYVDEPNVPGGHWPLVILDVTGWTTWGQVAEFVANSWADAYADGAEAITAEAERFRTGNTLEEAVRAVIRFVQEEVRYLAVDIGHGAGMVPNGAGTVLRRRFGDCKDKSVLLIALLRALDVEAFPLLVAPNWQEAVERVQPSTAAFSHALVTFVMGDRRYFVDPTLVGQGGDLERMVAPAYGHGLEVRVGAQGLLKLPDSPPADLSLIETFHLDRKQKEGSVEQKLRATSWLADDVRAALLRQGKAAFFKARADALQKNFPALVPDEQSASVREEGGTNAIELSTRHVLPTWGPAGQKPPDLFRYGGHGLFLAVEQVGGPERRKQPWALRYPLKVHHRVVVRGRCVRRPKDERHYVSGPGFRYSCEVSGAFREATFDYCWETMAREVPAEQWAEYRQKREVAFSRAGANVLTGSNRSQWIAAVFLGGMACLIGAGIVSSELAERPTDARQTPYADATRRSTLPPSSPSPFDSHLRNAEAALKLGNLKGAQIEIAAARRIGTPSVQLSITEALAAELAGDLPGARHMLIQALARSPRDHRALLGLARVNERLGEIAQAQTYWEGLMAQNQTPNTTSHYAQFLWRNGAQQRADQFFARALKELPPNSPLAASITMEYALATGRPDAALAAAARAGEQVTPTPQLLYRHAQALIRTGKIAEAREIARQITAKFPKDPLGWAALATSSALLKDQAVAENAFEQWMTYAPFDADARAEYGEYLTGAGHANEARVLLSKATTEFFGSGPVWLSYAHALEMQNEKVLAEEAKEKGKALLTPEQRFSRQQR